MIKTVGTIGAGQMGAGIAQSSALSGYKALLYDINEEALSKALNTIHKSLDKLIEKEVISQKDKESAISNLELSTNINDLKDSELVIEAVVEDFKIKTSIFNQVEKIVSANTIIASNTSSISITKMAAELKNPQNFIGIHFMNPVPLMKLVEIIKGEKTSEETYKISRDFVLSLNKTPVLAIDSPGFIINRILCPMINEAILLLEQGVSAEDIDTAMKLGANQPMGPLTLADFVGLDTLLSILNIFYKEFNDEKYKPCDLLIKYVEQGKLGRKSGEGFYKY